MKSKLLIALGLFFLLCLTAAAQSQPKPQVQQDTKPVRLLFYYPKGCVTCLDTVNKMKLAAYAEMPMFSLRKAEPNEMALVVRISLDELGKPYKNQQVAVIQQVALGYLTASGYEHVWLSGPPLGYMVGDAPYNKWADYTSMLTPHPYTLAWANWFSDLIDGCVSGAGGNSPEAYGCKLALGQMH